MPRRRGGRKGKGRKVEFDNTTREIPAEVAKEASDVGSRVTSIVGSTASAIAALSAWATSKTRGSLAVVSAGVEASKGAVNGFLSGGPIGAITGAGSSAAGAKEKAAQAKMLVRDVEDVKQWLTDIKNHIDAAQKIGASLCSTHDLVVSVSHFQDYFRSNYLTNGPAEVGFLVLWPEYYRQELVMAKQALADAWSEYNAERTDRLEAAVESVPGATFRRRRAKGLTSGEAGGTGSTVTAVVGSMSSVMSESKHHGEDCSWEIPEDWDNCPECTDSDSAHSSTRAQAAKAFAKHPHAAAAK